MLFSKWVTDGGKHSMHCVGNSFFNLWIAEWCLLFSLLGIGIIHVSRKGIFPMCFPAIRSPWSSLTVRIAGVQKVVQNTRVERQYTNGTFVVLAHLFAPLFRLVFCSLHFQALRHSLRLRLATINETKAWRHQMGLFYFRSLLGNFQTFSVKRFIIKFRMMFPPKVTYVMNICAILTAKLYHKCFRRR